MRINLTVSLLALACSFAAAQINTNTNFNIISPQPIDTRDTLTTLADTANVPSVQLFPGLLSYVVSLKQYWTYNGAYWEPLSKGFDLFVYAIANNADYSLPLDTLKKYNRVVLFTGSVTTSTRVTLPNLSGTTGLSGKKIEIRYSTGPSGIFSVGSASNIFRYNCSGYDIDEGPLTGDTLAFSLKDKIEYLIYGTSYLRHCPAIDVPDASPADTSTFLVYAPAHSLEDSITAYGYVPVKIDYTKANASAFDSTHFAYAVSAPHADTLELKLSGALAITGHGLTVGRLYYLQDDGTESTTSGTIRAPTVYVLDANTVVLTEVGADQDQVISRQAVPSPVFTFWGGDPQNPSDSIMQIVVDSVFAPAGLAKPSTIFFMSYSSQSKNPTYQDDSPTDSPLNPSHSWFYDGNVVTRMNHLLTSVDLQATSAGLFTLDTVMLIGGVPTDSTVANWLDTNYVQNNLRLPNGAVVYWKGNGTAQSPDYSWLIIDDITNTGETNDYKRILKKLRSPEIDLSVGLSLPSQFSVTGSPVTTSGTLAGAWVNQAANTVLAGPASGADAAPTFRSLVAADITAGGGVTGSGTANYVPKFSSSTALNNSMIYQRDTFSVGINTSNPLPILEVRQRDGVNRGNNMPGGISSNSIALALYNNPAIVQNQPGVVQYFTYGSTVSSAFPIQLVFMGTSTSNVKQVATIGAYAQSSASSTPFYVYIDSRNNGAYNNATLKIDNNNRIGVAIPSTTRPSYTLDVSGTDGARIPLGTTAQRPTGGDGVIRFNTTLASYEGYGSAAWNSILTTQAAAGKLADGSVAFGGPTGISEDNSNLFWNDTDNLLGIATNTPTARVHLPAGTTTTPSFRIEEGVNSSTPQDGAINHVSDRLNFTSGTTVNVLAHLSDITAVTTPLSPDDVPRWDGSAFQPSGITSDDYEVSISRSTAPHSIRFFQRYNIPNATPSSSSGITSVMAWNSSNVASFRVESTGVASGSTDGSGDLVVTIPTMPDATYAILATPNASIFHNVVITSWNTTSFTARFFDATGAAIASTAVSLNWQVKDY